MTPHREWFNYSKLGDFGLAYLGDDTTCIITRKGKIEIALDDGGVRTLGEVRYVLELRNNLIPLGTLQANGYLFRSDGDRDIMRVSKGSMRLMMEMRNVDNIYMLLKSTIMGDVASVETDHDATKMWHMRLGHPSECTMIELHKRNLLNVICNCTIGLCNYCVFWKQ